MQKHKILLVEDDRMISEIVLYNLTKEGFEACSAVDGEEGLARFFSEKPDIVLLDVMLPGLDGFSVLRRIRSESNTPVIMLTAREEEADKVAGLELGADDYITKPFSMREMLARIKANLRRAAVGNGAEGASLLVCGDISMDTEGMAAYKSGVPLELSARELELLKLMLLSPNKVLSRELLMEKVWGYQYYGDDLRAVDTAVRRLREKVEDDPASPRYILTKRSAGYYLAQG